MTTKITNANITNTGVTAGSYTNANITVNAQGQLTSASSGSSGVSWQAVQTTGFTAVSGRGYPCNTTSAAFTVTLPASPTAGDLITLVDYAGTWDTNNLTISPNGNKVEGSTTNQTISTNRGAVNLVYVDSTQGWITYANVATDIVVPATVSVDYLVVAGGGGGGGYGGGGGAGGYQELLANSLFTGTVYPVTVGAGGAGGAAGSNGGVGNNSVFASFTASVAGGRGSGSTYPTANNGGDGGSGGGAAPGSTGGAGQASGIGGNGTSGQGNNGGAAFIATSNAYSGFGGGGGAGTGATGGSATSSASGNGGAGKTSTITGLAYAGGGGGGGDSRGTTAGTGGSSVGGNGSTGVGSAATANRGGGGGGGGYNGSTTNAGGNGGSGVVVIKIPDTFTATFSAGVTQTSSTAGGYKTYTITQTSTTSETVTFS